MVILGIVLLLVGYILAIPLILDIGVVLLAVGALLFVFGAVRGPVAGRRYWF